MMMWNTQGAQNVNQNDAQFALSNSNQNMSFNNNTSGASNINLPNFSSANFVPNVGQTNVFNKETPPITPSTPSNSSIENYRKL